MRVTNDLDELTIGDDGWFNVIVAAERPAGYTGDWWPLDPRTRRLLMRKCACDWRNEVDARVAVNRLDVAGEDMPPAEFARRFSDMPAWIEGMIQFDMHLVRYYREHHGINVLLRSQWIEEVGGLAKQAYYDGSTRSTTTRRSSSSSRCPSGATTGRSSSPTTGSRPSTGSTGSRASTSPGPRRRRRGVPRRRLQAGPGRDNWLDKADFPWGILQARFYRANEYPEATVTKVPVADVLEHLPAGTPTLTPASARRSSACDARAHRSGGSGDVRDAPAVGELGPSVLSFKSASFSTISKRQTRRRTIRPDTFPGFARSARTAVPPWVRPACSKWGRGV